MKLIAVYCAKSIYICLLWRMTSQFLIFKWSFVLVIELWEKFVWFDSNLYKTGIFKWLSHPIVLFLIVLMILLKMHPQFKFCCSILLFTVGYFVCYTRDIFVPCHFMKFVAKCFGTFGLWTFICLNQSSDGRLKWATLFNNDGNWKPVKENRCKGLPSDIFQKANEYFVLW